jgi:hypothetical protein
MVFVIFKQKGLTYMKKSFFVIPTLLLALLGVCGITFSATEVSTYTLYRDSSFDSSKRWHVATFNASHGDAYNKENCEIAQTLFQNQPKVAASFFCEKGLFKE